MESRTAYQPVVPLSDDKLSIFLSYISSGSLTLSSVRHALSRPSGTINVLKTLIPLYTSRVPWGSLAYHYSNLPINSLMPEDVFEKVIIQGRGGHCLELVPLFASVLRGLGYELYLTGARICEAITEGGPGFHGWSHLVLIVTIEGQRYIVDPQFQDMVEPALLDPNGPEVHFHGIPTTFMRLRRCPLSEIVPYGASRSGLKTWLIEFRHSSESPWTPAYIFDTETEWYLQDLHVMNVWLAKAADSYLVTLFRIKRNMLVGVDDPDRGTSIVGTSGVDENGSLIVPKLSGMVEISNSDLKVWRGGQKVVDEKIETEDERLNLIKKWFGITLNEDEIKAIKGRPTALS